MLIRILVAIVFYDHLLTFSLEVHVFWRREVGWPTLIYLFNRYLCMAFGIALVYPIGTRAVSIAKYPRHYILTVDTV